MRLIAMIFGAAVLAQAQNLIPAPARLVAGQGKFLITEKFHVAFSGYREPRLEAAAIRLVARLAKRTGLAIGRIPGAGNAPAALTIACEKAGARVQNVREGESYSLTVSPAGARLHAPNPLGILRGMETFLQLVDQDSEGFFAPAVNIEDTPRFPWRGLMIDVSRHFMPPEAIKRNLDAMAAVKLNVFHWHLSDDQGFRVESKLFPKLQGMGSDGLYYTQAQVREIVAYARSRGIRVVPEFDVPGHTSSWFPGYPELAATPGPYEIERDGGTACMDPARESTYRFLDKFIGEMAALFPDPYLHTGGDEVSAKQWDANPRIRAFKKRHGMKHSHELQAYFEKRLAAIVKKHGKRMMGWDEILQPGLAKNVVVQSWRGQKSLDEAARQGYLGILSHGYYLDLMLPASQHYAADPLGNGGASLTPEERTRILGGEACMWDELVTPENLDGRIWPRNAAIAERLWSPGTVTDVESMYRRLEILSRELERDGLTRVSGYRLMLERLAGGYALEPVKTLADIVEPVKEYKRMSTGRYTSFTPLNRLVDCARPESETARHFGKLVDRLTAGQASADEREALRTWLVRWRDNDARLKPALELELLKEAAPLSNDVAALAEAGLGALERIAAGKHDPEWAEGQSALVARAREPRAELLISIVPLIEKLIAAAR
jgi:hexosaminidase